MEKGVSDVLHLLNKHQRPSDNPALQGKRVAELVGFAGRGTG
jgi:hypothetical protein